MADISKRLRYYSGQFLQEKDFTDEQEYHLDRQRRHNRLLHAHGIAEGLTVTAEVGAASVTVSRGTAIDNLGRMIILTEERIVHFGQLTGPALVVISYGEGASDPSTVGDEGNTRFWEQPEVRVIAQAGAPAPDEEIQLARLHISAAGTLDRPQDPSVRTSAGKLGAGTLEVQNPLGDTLQVVKDQNDRRSPVMLSTTQVEVNTMSEKAVIFKVVGNIPSAPLMEVANVKDEASIRFFAVTDETAWHMGTGGMSGKGHFFFWNDKKGVVVKIAADGTLTANGLKLSHPGVAADVTGDLSVTGKIVVSGTVDGRDLSADGARLDALERSTLEGVGNAGGNIDLVGQNGITVTGDNSAKTITISNAAGNLSVPGPLNAQLQRVKENERESPMWISTTQVEVKTTGEKAVIFRVDGNVASAPLMEVANVKDEASIRFFAVTDETAWHMGTGGLSGKGNFFFWNDKKGVVAKIGTDGTLIVNGLKLNGRDVSADGARLDNLERSTLEGVSNPGGNVDLVGQNGITVTGDNATKTITIGNAAGSLKLANPLGPANQYVQDANGLESGLSIGSGKHVGVGTKTPGFLLTVAGDIQTAPLMEVHNVKDEASIRYRAVTNGTDWHVGTGGHGGQGNFFFWNTQKAVVGTITPEGTLTLSNGLVVKNIRPQAEAPAAVQGRLKQLLIDPDTGVVYRNP